MRALIRTAIIYEWPATAAGSPKSIGNASMSKVGSSIVAREVVELLSVENIEESSSVSDSELIESMELYWFPGTYSTVALL